jgi:hypothetical protein
VIAFAVERVEKCSRTFTKEEYTGLMNVVRRGAIARILYKNRTTTRGQEEIHLQDEARPYFFERATGTWLTQAHPTHKAMHMGTCTPTRKSKRNSLIHTQ